MAPTPQLAPAVRRARPETLLSRLTDLVHRAMVRLRGERVVKGTRHTLGGHAARGGVGVRANRLVAFLADERTEAEFRRMARAVRGTVRAHAGTARRRLAAPGAAARAAGRELVDAAVSTARRMGAQHRHVPGTTDSYHDLAAQILARARKYGAARAAGERGLFARSPREDFAWQ